ncbi:hypothetical protein [Eubacterium sp.]|uniref:hypothetical protein n=1 Tax=Eubacterium sp. TaxID=142586 RepID=UPI001DD04C58|nr:hypothetical protein [Eubacterium sp.]MBS5619874.1 hypothetical protein [Eubacterium sp.]
MASFYIISGEQYEEYKELKKKNKPMRYDKCYCPVCDYVTDNCVPRQNYCDRCGQRLYKRWYKKK